MTVEKKYDQFPRKYEAGLVIGPDNYDSSARRATNTGQTEMGASV